MPVTERAFSMVKESVVEGGAANHNRRCFGARLQVWGIGPVVTHASLWLAG
jgi:hypothetical protein